MMMTWQRALTRPVRIAAALFATSISVVGEAALAQAADSVYEAKMHSPGVRMIPVEGGKYKLWSRRIGDGKIKVLLLHGGPSTSPEYFENFPEHLGRTTLEIAGAPARITVIWRFQHPTDVAEDGRRIDVQVADGSVSATFVHTANSQLTWR